MKKYNPYLYVDQLTESQLRDFVYAVLDRNRIQVEMNNVSLFRYDLATDMMFLSCQNEDGKAVQYSFSNYLKERDTFLFDSNSQVQLFEAIERVVSNLDKNTSGNIQLRRKDGTLVDAEYTVSRNASGEISAIVGQLVDYLQTPKQLHETIRSLNDYIATTEGLQSAYETVLSIDLQTYAFRLIKGTPAVFQAASQVSNVNQLAMVFCKYQIEPEFHEGFLQFADPLSLSDRLYGQKVIAYDYLTKNIGWCHARMIPVTYDEDGNVTQVVFTTESTTERTNQLNYLRVAAEHDGLTGLLNRVTGERDIEEQLTNKKPALFAIFDCDDFKFLNDSLGHPTGDIVLREIANAFTTHFQNGINIRLGGDEFVTFLTEGITANMSEKEILDLFKPLRQQIAQINIPQLNGRTITLSGGIALYNGIFNSSFEKLYHKADKALYNSKKNRKNSITVV